MGTFIFVKSNHTIHMTQNRKKERKTISFLQTSCLSNCTGYRILNVLDDRLELFPGVLFYATVICNPQRRLLMPS